MLLHKYFGLLLRIRSCHCWCSYIPQKQCHAQFVCVPSRYFKCLRMIFTRIKCFHRRVCGLFSKKKSSQYPWAFTSLLLISLATKLYNLFSISLAGCFLIQKSLLNCHKSYQKLSKHKKKHQESVNTDLYSRFHVEAFIRQAGDLSMFLHGTSESSNSKSGWRCMRDHRWKPLTSLK